MKSIILIGRGTLAVECLQALKATGSPPKIVICDPLDTGKDSWSKSLFKACIKEGYTEGETVFRERNVNEKAFLRKLKKISPDTDYIFSVQTRSILHDDFIQLANEYVYNLHLAPLPKLRGVHPSAWAILDGLKKMGVTIHLIENAHIDAGPIVLQKLFPVTSHDTVWTLYKKCEKHGIKLLQDNMRALISSKIKLRKQNERQATYHSLKELDFADNQIPYNLSADKTLRYIRSRIFPPLQLPYFLFKGKNVYIEAATARKTNNVPEQIERHGKTFILPCTDGVIVVSKYKHRL